MSTTTRTDIPTTTIECSCKFCAEYADRKDLTLPLRAEVNVKMLAAIGATPKGRHSLVKKAVQPPLGIPDQWQQRFGPWAV